MKRSFLLHALVALAVPAHAHFLWASLDPTTKTVAVGLQEIPGDAPLPLAERAVRVKAWARSSPPLALSADGNWLRSPVGENTVGASLDYGVLDRSQEGRARFWLRYYAKAATTLAASQASVGLPVELTATPGKDGTMITVLREGKPAEGAEVVVELPGGKTAFEGKTSPLGTVVLPRMGTPLAVRALVTDNVKGPGYDLIRSYSTLTVAAALPPSAPEATTLSRLLHDSFGSAHDVVSHSGFIETVMAGKLTKAQLIDHLRQRDYVLASLDRVLSQAKGLPYGPEQRNVLGFLRDDLKALGAGEGPAWPSTKAFVAEIEKGDAYFALGVFHVYYGGVTNGGRDIGAMIGDQTGYPPTHYLKTDGYPAYLKLLNAATVSPEARQSMILGGQAAYRYIITVNNDSAFMAR